MLVAHSAVVFAQNTENLVLTLVSEFSVARNQNTNLAFSTKGTRVQSYDERETKKCLREIASRRITNCDPFVGTSWVSIDDDDSAVTLVFDVKHRAYFTPGGEDTVWTKYSLDQLRVSGKRLSGGLSIRPEVSATSVL